MKNRIHIWDKSISSSTFYIIYALHIPVIILFFILLNDVYNYIPVLAGSIGVPLYYLFMLPMSTFFYNIAPIRIFPQSLETVPINANSFLSMTMFYIILGGVLLFLLRKKDKKVKTLIISIILTWLSITLLSFLLFGSQMAE